jgi:endonuclease/exonuclease/phosphatase family metal-dependent hydrolase
MANRISVLSYNCNKGNCKIGSIGSIITESDPDIICLQEYNQTIALELVPYNLEEKYVFITSNLYQGWSGNVIYSKFPVIKSKFIQNEGKSRVTPIIQVQTAKTIITVACVHLEPGRANTAIRHKQYNRLLDLLAGNLMPTIIIGDFNMSDNEIQWPPNGWGSHQLIPTYTTNNPCVKSPSKFGHPFDRCLYKGLIMDEINLIGVNNPPSDHYGLLAHFHLPLEPEKSIISLPVGKNYMISITANDLNNLMDVLTKYNIFIVGVDNKWLSPPLSLKL